MTDVVMSIPSLGRQAWNFAQHFLEMCLSMCLVGTPLVVAAFVWGPAAFGYADPRQQSPELSLLAIAVIYALPMVGWMRFRGMQWRPVLEMAGVTIAPAVALIGLESIGVLPLTSLRDYVDPSYCGLACVLMLPAMFLRLGMYTGRTGHHMHHGADALGAM